MIDVLQIFKYGTPDQNRTDNYPLGGGYYIHLTTGANILVTIPFY